LGAKVRKKFEIGEVRVDFEIKFFSESKSGK
jgi:hypothetical protein